MTSPFRCSTIAEETVFPRPIEPRSGVSFFTMANAPELPRKWGETYVVPL